MKITITIFFIFLCLNADAKRIAAIKNNEVYFVCNEGEEKYLVNDYDTIKEIPQGIDESFIAVDENGNIYQREKTQEETDGELKSKILQDMSKGKDIITEVLLLNDKRQASDSVKILFLANPNVKQARELLELGRLSLAKGVIQSVQTDETVITEEVKAAVLELLKDY